jgi:effector-binding domain-containing protein
MASRCEIIEKEIGPVVEIEERAFIWQMPAAFRRDYGLLSRHIEAQGSSLNGMPYARYLDIDWEREQRAGMLSKLRRMLTARWHFQVGMPTEERLPADAAIHSRVFAPRRYARTIHTGPYRAVGQTYNALIAWLQGQGEQAEGEAFEVYLNSPEEVAEEALETEILVPLK